MKRILIVISFVFTFAFAPILLMAVVQNWSATNLQAVSSFYVGSKNVFSFLAGLDTNNRTVTNSIGDSTITGIKLHPDVLSAIGAGGGWFPDAYTIIETNDTLSVDTTIIVSHVQLTPADTAELKLLYFDGMRDGAIASLKKLSSSASINTGGFFRLHTGTYTADAYNYFKSTANAQKVWIREPGKFQVFNYSASAQVWNKDATEVFKDELKLLTAGLDSTYFQLPFFYGGYPFAIIDSVHIYLKGDASSTIDNITLMENNYGLGVLQAAGASTPCTGSNQIVKFAPTNAKADNGLVLFVEYNVNTIVEIYTIKLYTRVF